MTTSVQQTSGGGAWVDLSHQVWSLSGDALIEIAGDQETSTLSVQYISSMATGEFKDLAADGFDLVGGTPWDLADYVSRTGRRGEKPMVRRGDVELRGLSRAAVRIALSMAEEDARVSHTIVPTSSYFATPSRQDEIVSGVIPSSGDIASRWGVALTDLVAAWLSGSGGVDPDMTSVVSERLRELPIPVYGSPPSGIKDFAGWLSSSGGFSYAIAHTAADSMQDVAVYMGFLTPAVAVGFKLAWPAVDNLSKKIDQWTGEAFGLAGENSPKRPAKTRSPKPPVKKRKQSGD